jgi:hypothetical protein
MEIAARCGDGKRSGGRMDMEEGFLLDRVQMNGARVAVDQGKVFSVPVFPNPAEASLPFRHLAPFGAELTLDGAPIQGLEIRGKFRLDQALLGSLGMSITEGAEDFRCRQGA